MNRSRLAFFLLLSAVPTLCQQPSPASNDPRTRGAQAFTENGCPQCHTIRQHGGTKGPDLTSVGRRLNEEQIRSQILKGGKQMPAFGGILETSEANDLVAYLLSLRDDDKATKKP
ncbi:MAG TPA: cytochrome c [Edaphobacter sp.]|nr:cytochrome c [Edaphobacter sp.]